MSDTARAIDLTTQTKKLFLDTDIDTEQPVTLFICNGEYIFSGIHEVDNTKVYAVYDYGNEYYVNHTSLIEATAFADTQGDYRNDNLERDLFEWGSDIGIGYLPTNEDWTYARDNDLFEGDYF